MRSKAVFRHARPAGVDALVPLDQEGIDILQAMDSDKGCMVEIYVPRNGRHHSLLFHLFEMLRDGGVWDGTKEDLLDYIKYAVGHVRTSIDHKGQVHYVPKSIAYESMDQVHFNRFFNRAVYVVCQRLLGGAEWKAVRDQIIEVVDGRYLAQANHRKRGTIKG